jgi:hypothetical protein
MICAALQAQGANQRANQRANHFLKDSRYFRNEAQTILPTGANHFGRARKPFCQPAQVKINPSNC